MCYLATMQAKVQSCWLVFTMKGRSQVTLRSRYNARGEDLDRCRYRCFDRQRTICGSSPLCYTTSRWYLSMKRFRDSGVQGNRILFSRPYIASSQANVSLFLKKREDVLCLSGKLIYHQEQNHFELKELPYVLGIG